MRLLSLEVQNYRNIASASLTPGRELTVICGNNGQGKTNLLEAIWLLTGGKTSRGGKDTPNWCGGANPSPCYSSTLRAQQEEQEPDTPNRVRMTIGMPDSARPGRYAAVNGAPPKRAAALAGSFPAVVFDPGHLSLVRRCPGGPPEISGCCLVSALPQLSHHLPPLCPGITAEKCAAAPLQHHAGTALRRKDGPAGSARHRACRAGRGHPAAAAGLSGTAGPPRLRQLRRAFPRRGADGAALCSPVRAGWSGRSAAGPAERGTAGRAEPCGPHREDLELLLDGQPAKVFASQGQQRSVVLSLKMAEAAAAASITGEHPVLLLDDVLSELDDGRKQYLLTRMREKQTFVTSCDDTAFLKTDGEVYRMNGGVLTKL